MSLLNTIIISLIFSLIAFLILRKDKVSAKYKLLLSLIIFIGVFVRLYRIDAYPVGLNQDEASIGYEAISIFNYGIDRFGMSYPVHLIAWGSGQNALYAYLIMPFIKIVTNEILLIRLPMALLGSFTLLFLLYFIKREELNKKGIIILLLFAIMPWHIMKSRWGLESNIFPDIVFYGLLLLYFGIKNKKKILYISAAIVFGISTYAYGTSYLYIPLMLILIYYYLIKSKKITLKEGVVYFLITGIVALPMVLFVVINYFDLEPITIFKITIPRLYSNRFVEKSSFNGNIILNIVTNFIKTIKIIFLGIDDEHLNSIVFSGLFYSISIPFLIYGVYLYFKEKKYQKNLYLKLMYMALIAGLVVSVMVKSNINRLNILWIPLYVFIILGILAIDNKYFKAGILSLYVISFIIFNCYYYGGYQEVIANDNNVGFREAIKSVSGKENVYITDRVNQPYIFWLYYNKVSPYYYIENRHIVREDIAFQSIDNIGNTYFYIAGDNILDRGSTYIMPFDAINVYVIDGCKVNVYNNYVVLDC